MLSSPLRARYIGYTKDTENHGDESLFWIIRDLLAPQIVVEINPQKYEIALLGGGTLINQSSWLIPVFRGALDQARAGIVFGTGVGDLDFWGDSFSEWVPLLHRCRLVGVRGPLSLGLLQERGIEHAQVIGDPYLWLQSPIERMCIEKRLGVNIGSTNNSLWGTTDDDLLIFIGNVLERLRDEGWSFEWFSVWEKDLPLLEKLHNRVDNRSRHVIDVRRQTLEAYSALSCCQVFLGEKLHACAMAAVAEVPFIALEYQPKVRDFASSLKMDAWVISTAVRDSGFLLETIHSLRSNHADIRHSLQLRRLELRERIIDFAQRVKHEMVNTAESL